MAEPLVTVRPNSPYIVAGEVPLAVQRPIETEHGEPVAWERGEPIATKAIYLLCRCGSSATKPFCDGAHKQAGFDGTETDDRAPVASRQTVFRGPGLQIRDDHSLCMHAGFCGDRFTKVWAMLDDAADAAVRARIMTMVDLCPSGALAWATVDDEPDHEPELPAEIGVVPDGPLWVTGSIAVQRADGSRMEPRNRVTLCRCGASNLKPVCDGTHKDIGFRG